MTEDLNKLLKGKVLEKLKANLALFFGFPVEVRLKAFKQTDLEDISRTFGDPEEHNVVIVMKVMGTLPGYLISIFPVSSAVSLIHHLLGASGEAEGEWGELERSAIKETSNLIAGTMLTVLSDALGKSLVASVPGMTTDMILASVDIALNDLAKVSDTTSVLEMEFIDHDMRGLIFYLLDDKSYETLVKGLSNA